MTENTKIEWCDHTFNPFIGCTKVSPGCDNCYTEHLMDKRMHKVVWGAHGERVRTSAANWRKPLAWNAAHAAFFAAHGRRQRVFCASLSDVFDNAVDPAWRRDLFELIASTPNLDWLLLTKRIGNAADMIVDALLQRRGLAAHARWPWPNVWLGATIVNQAEADRDIPKLLAVPARVHFLSMEPLLGPVSFEGMFTGNDYPDHSNALEELSWVIVGGESGPNARPMHPQWVRDIRDQCEAAATPLLLKQWGAWHQTDAAAGDDLGGDMRRGNVRIVKPVGENDSHFRCGDVVIRDGHFRRGDVLMRRVGKKAAGRLLDGRLHDDTPCLAESFAQETA